MRLIPNWKRAHRMLSVQVGVAFVGWGMLDPATQAAILAFVGIPAHRIPAVVGLIAIAARLIDQSALKLPKVEKP